MTLDFLSGYEFFAGVPDSFLSALCQYLLEHRTLGKDHIIAANEGNAVALAAGYHLATGKVPVVYLQNSGIGNIINPVASLLNREVYAIPCLFIVGWRGEPDIKDEPQHVFQGKVTKKLLADMDIDCFVIDKETKAEEVSRQLAAWQEHFAAGGQAALIVKKGAFSHAGNFVPKSYGALRREEIIETVTAASGNDLLVSTTGKASRELFEIRERKQEGHGHDFLTVGSMGHSSSIALGLALSRPERKVWVIDGDGAVLMHMGAMAVIGAHRPKNLVHIVINNAAHESVGGMPTVADKTDLAAVAKACGYPEAVRVENIDELKKALRKAADNNELCFIEARAAVGARDDLGRPTTSARQNKELFMGEITA